MALFTASSLIESLNQRYRSRGLATNASTELANETRTFNSAQGYDIFLSHSFLDAKVVLGLKHELERRRFSVYVYWVEDPQSRETVNAETADRLRKRMESCKGMLYASSQNAANSKWMPWELGYFDGIKQKIAIVPIALNTEWYFEGFRGQEYLDLYPYISREDGGGDALYVWGRNKIAIRGLRDWLTSNQ